MNILKTIQRFQTLTLKRSYNKVNPIQDNHSYWVKRSKELGELAVLDNRHKKSEIQNVTDFQISNIFPHLKRALKGKEKLALDFGCGTGRFSGKLADLINGKTVAVDPMEDLISLAAHHANVNYCVVKDGKLPLEDNSVDVLWICLVLGGIKEFEINDILSELNRVCKKDAAICLVENTSEKDDAPHWYFRDANWYSKKFYFASLMEAGIYYDFDEKISIMIGHKDGKKIN